MTLERAGKDLRFEFTKAGSRLSFELGGDVLSCRGIFAGQTASVLPVERDNLNLTRTYNDLAVVSGTEDFSMISALRSVFWALMCGVDRFNATDAARRLESVERAVMPSETSMSLGSEQFQLVRDMPLMQAVAKLTLQRRGSPLETDDSVLTALCRQSRPLGTDAVADALLVLAFIRIHVSSLTTQDAFILASQLGLDPNCDLSAV